MRSPTSASTTRRSEPRPRPPAAPRPISRQSDGLPAHPGGPGQRASGTAAAPSPRPPGAGEGDSAAPGRGGHPLRATPSAARPRRTPPRPRSTPRTQPPPVGADGGRRGSRTQFRSTRTAPAAPPHGASSPRRPAGQPPPRRAPKHVGPTGTPLSVSLPRVPLSGAPPGPGGRRAHRCQLPKPAVGPPARGCPVPAADPDAARRHGAGGGALRHLRAPPDLRPPPDEAPSPPAGVPEDPGGARHPVHGGRGRSALPGSREPLDPAAPRELDGRDGGRRGSWFGPAPAGVSEPGRPSPARGPARPSRDRRRRSRRRRGRSSSGGSPAHVDRLDGG